MDSIVTASISPLPLTERIASLIRGQATGISREEVEQALPDIDPREVRGALNMLRTAHAVDAILDDSKVVYRAKEHRPARVAGSAMKVIRAKPVRAGVPKPPHQRFQQQEAAMPRGVYPRNPRKPAAATTEPATNDAPSKKGRGGGRRKVAAAVPHANANGGGGDKRLLRDFRRWLGADLDRGMQRAPHARCRRASLRFHVADA